MSALTMILALCIDSAIGWPDGLFRRIGHPVTWIGRMISSLDRNLNRASENRSTRIAAGALACAMVVGTAVAVAAAIAAALPEGWVGAILAAVLAWPLLAARSLHVHVGAIIAPLSRGDLPVARVEVAKIVGRDADRLDAPGIARATLESLGENASDGVVAPLFWGAVLGLPGIAAYKAVNTMDSMIGYRTEAHEAFGKVAARVDDVMNWIPARLTALAFAIASGRPGRVLRVAWRDAPLHRSPNAGWPEAALAAALNCRLSGPRAYGDTIEEHPWVNPGTPDPSHDTIRRGLTAYRQMLVVVGIGLFATGIWWV